MKYLAIGITVFSYVLAVSGQNTSVERGWKGIRVFSSSKEAVEKILGQPSKTDDKIWTVYRTTDATIAVDFSGKPCEESVGEKGDFNIPENTVLEYVVTFNKPLPLSTIKWEREKYSMFFDREPAVKSYSNPLAGIWMTTNVDESCEIVTQLWYRATDAEKRKFRCSPK